MEPCECKWYATRWYTGTLQALYRSTGYPPTPLPPYPSKALSTPLDGVPMTQPQIGDLYTYNGVPILVFIITKVDQIQVNLRRIDNGRETITTRSMFEDRYTPLCARWPIRSHTYRLDRSSNWSRLCGRWLGMVSRVCALTRLAHVLCYIYSIGMVRALGRYDAIPALLTLHITHTHITHMQQSLDCPHQKTLHNYMEEKLYITIWKKNFT